MSKDKTMRFNALIELGNATETLTLGEIVQTYTYRNIYANELTISQKEFYESNALGLKPELAFQIRAIDYQSDERIRYNGVIYEIIRSSKKGEFISLICSRHNG
jgi:SPP1 family predicted phage head-tail adaptor